jgi:hypothetical protein
LEEAECVRGFIHMMHGKDLIAGSDASIGLRINASIHKQKKTKKKPKMELKIEYKERKKPSLK